MSGRCREVLSDAQEWWGRFHACLGVVGRPSRMYGSGGDDFTHVRE